MCGDELSSCLLQVPDTVGEVLRETAKQYENQTAAKLLVDFVEYKVRFAHHQCEQAMVDIRLIHYVKHDVIYKNRKYIAYRNSAPQEDPATDIRKARKKFGEDRTCSSGDILADQQTERHGHHNTPLICRKRNKHANLIKTNSVSCRHKPILEEFQHTAKTNMLQSRKRRLSRLKAEGIYVRSTLSA